MGLLFVGLLGFGTGGLSGNIRNIGSAGDKDISVRQYQQALNQQIRAFEAQIGSPVGFAQAQQLGIDRAVLTQVVAERSLDHEASTMGLSVGDARVRDEVLRVPAFRGVDGQFDREAYRFALERSGLTEAAFEANIRDEVARTLLQSAVVGGVSATDTYANTLMAFIGETRDMTWAPVTADLLADPVAAPSDAEIQAFYDANPADFTTPEVRAISYAWLTPDMIQDQITIDEDALRGLYEDRNDEFNQPERRLVERLIYPDQAAADAALDEATDMDTDFEDLVAARGLDLADVDLGDVSLADLGDAGDAVFAAEVGNIVGPIDTTLGPALYRVNAVLAAQTVTFEEASNDLREELSAARARRIIEDEIDRINDMMAGGAALEDLVQATDMQLGQIAWTADTRDEIAAYEEFRAAAATAEQGAFPELITLDDGGIFALRLDAVTPPAVQPLAATRDTAIAGATAQATQAAIAATAADLATQILPLTGFDTLGLAPTVEQGLTRRSFVAGTPPVFMTEVFEMAVGDVRVIDNGAGAILVRLDGIAAADTSDPQNAAQKEATAEVAAAGIAQDVFEAYSNAVQMRTDVQINQAAVNAVNAQLQ